MLSPGCYLCLFPSITMFSILKQTFKYKIYVNQIKCAITEFSRDNETARLSHCGTMAWNSLAYANICQKYRKPFGSIPAISLGPEPFRTVLEVHAFLSVIDSLEGWTRPETEIWKAGVLRPQTFPLEQKRTWNVQHECLWLAGSIKALDWPDLLQTVP